MLLFCRVKYDAYRQRVDSMKAAQVSGRDVPSSMKVRELEAALQLHKQRYERLQSDLVIKLKFLEENKVNWHIIRVVGGHFTILFTIFCVKLCVYICTFTLNVKCQKTIYI